ncbi:Rep family protein, partial [Nesterenkonia massiliensis]|uniref:Rep family protein n=1 Tax=Nesterenkonia massiliensis TaxID=1232429 RepID=UPI0011C93C0A
MDHQARSGPRRRGEPRLDHVHVIIDQGQSKLHCIQIDQAMGWSPKRVVRAPKRGGRISNAQGYLIHAKDPQKHQYGVDEVVTLRGLDYVEVEAEHRDAWARRAVMDRKAAVPQKEWAELGDALVQRVLDGEVDELDILKDKTLGDIYARNWHDPL